MLRSYWCDFSNPYIVLKGDITVGAPNNAKKTKTTKDKIKQWDLEIMHNLSTAFQKLMA